MAGITSTGYPYPDPGDPIRDGAAAIKALAATIPQSASGALSVTPSAVDTATALAVTFPRAFPVPPDVILGNTNGPPAANYSQAIWATNVTTTGFNAMVKRQTLTAVGVAWIARCNGQA